MSGWSWAYPHTSQSLILQPALAWSGGRLRWPPLASKREAWATAEGSQLRDDDVTVVLALINAICLTGIPCYLMCPSLSNHTLGLPADNGCNYRWHTWVNHDASPSDITDKQVTGYLAARYRQGQCGNTASAQNGSKLLSGSMLSLTCCDASQVNYHLRSECIWNLIARRVIGVSGPRRGVTIVSNSVGSGNAMVLQDDRWSRGPESQILKCSVVVVVAVFPDQ